jgi:hypothetical protein
MRASSIIATASVLALVGCATRPPPPEGATGAPFSIERDLVGRTVAEGNFSAINGQKRRFTAVLNGSWDGKILTLVEDFTYEDGQTDRKTWRLEEIAPGRFRGQREDVVGYADGFQEGPHFRLEYRVRLGSRVVKFRDVIALGPEGKVLNDATVGLYGLRVARVSLVIRRG